MLDVASVGLLEVSIGELVSPSVFWLLIATSDEVVLAVREIDKVDSGELE